MYGKDSINCIADSHGNYIALSLQAIKARQGRRLTGLDCLGFIKAGLELFAVLRQARGRRRSAD